MSIWGQTILPLNIQFIVFSTPCEGPIALSTPRSDTNRQRLASAASRRNLTKVWRLHHAIWKEPIRKRLCTQGEHSAASPVRGEQMGMSLWYRNLQALPFKIYICVYIYMYNLQNLEAAPLPSTVQSLEERTDWKFE